MVFYVRLIIYWFNESKLRAILVNGALGMKMEVK